MLVGCGGNYGCYAIGSNFVVRSEPMAPSISLANVLCNAYNTEKADIIRSYEA